MLAYKIAKHDTIRVLITLEIPDDACTNLSRTNVAVKETAMYRANKAKVLKIEDIEGTTYTTAITNYRAPFHYTVGEYVEEPTFDRSLENVSKEGIHFFLDKHVAELFELEKVENGIFIGWHPNGHIMHETTFVNGIRHGLTRLRLDTGQLWFETSYVNGDLEGVVTTWYKNGQKATEILHRDGKMDGLFQGWYENGKKQCETMYVGGIMHGLARRWSEEGILTEISYADGVPQDQHMQNKPDGSLLCEGDYVSGEM